MPAPATSPGTAPAVDAPPTVTPALTGRGALRALLAGRLRVATTAERASLRVELRVDARTARKLHLTTRSTAVTIATGTRVADEGRPDLGDRACQSAKAKRALARLRSVKVTSAPRRPTPRATAAPARTP